MSDLRDRFAAFGGKLVEGGAEMSRKVGQRLNSAGDRMKELFSGSSSSSSSQADKAVEDATSERNGWTPDWGKNLELCDMVNADDGLSGQDVVKSIKKRMGSKSPAVQLLSLILLETCVKNCEKMFSEVASERVLDEMVKIVDDSTTSTQNREKALTMIEAWGEATEELRYLPVFEETYKSLKARGIMFPGRDAESLAPIFTPPQSVATAPAATMASDGLDAATDQREVLDVARNTTELLSTVLSSSPEREALQDEITTALVEQCRQSQARVQRLIERSGEDEPLMFEGLQVNDELQRVLQKFEELSLGQQPKQEPQQPRQPAFVVADEEEGAEAKEEDSLVRSRGKPAQKLDDEQSLGALDEMIFGKASSSAKKQGAGDDMITF